MSAGRLTPEESRLADELVSLIDYTGRVLYTALDGRGPYYLWEKSRELARVANRVAEILDDDRGDRDTHTVRLPAVARAVEAWSQRYTAGRALFGRRGGAR